MATRVSGLSAMLLVAWSSSAAAELVVVAPVAWQVSQRGVPARIELSGTGLFAAGARIECRLLTASMGPEPAPPLPAAASAWRPLAVEPADPNAPNRARASVDLPAGGWYRLEVRAASAGIAAVEPFGVGEVFVVAGQSYATNTNDERLVVADPRRRVAALDVETGRWRLANDPQPAPDRSDGGSIWPAVGDRLAAELDMPIGFVNVAFSATSTQKWAADGPLSARLHKAGRMVGRFGAVLWQQGESDVMAGTSTDDYVARLQAIRAAAVEAWGFEPVWLCAFSTHHPTVYQNPEGETRIRAAISRLGTLPGFGLGPDTDTLQGPDRGGPGSRRHFSPAGQRNAAALWSDLLLKKARP
ncbi:MAG: sialate O-acetylesterase [Planctomycetaceae bacterium]|nr:sialate O-acetylesterase [Planctomycetaceae bacterium]